MNKEDHEYSLQILLPASVEEAFRQWSVQVNTTWPQWGGHITLLSRFKSRQPDMNLQPILTPFIQEICRRYEPFFLRFETIKIDEHFVRQGLQTVLLVGEPESSSVETLSDIQRDLVKKLTPHIQFCYPQVALQTFIPHLSLTLGLPVQEADQLAEQARLSDLNLNFRVETLSLLTFAPKLDESTTASDHQLLEKRVFTLQAR